MDMKLTASDMDDGYEFDAPSHVIDFKTLDSADNADHWFETQASGDHELLATPLHHGVTLGGNTKANLPKAVVSPRMRPLDSEEPSTSSAPPANIVTSWGPRGTTQKTTVQPRVKASAKPPAQPRRVSKRKESASQQDEAAVIQVAPPVKKLKRSSTSRQPIRKSYSVRSSGGLDPRSATKARALAANRSMLSEQQKSSEQQELERIRSLQRKVAEQRKKNEASYKAAMAGSQLPKKMAPMTTVPMEFNFSKDVRTKPSVSSDTAHREVDFTAQLRQHPASPAKGPRATTVPEPFNLSAGSRRKVEATAYVSIAQQVKDFQNRTPARYHLRSRQSQARGPSPVKAEHPHLTQAHTPQLMTRQRSRPTTAKSSQELEDEELQKLQQFQFKALELNRKILASALNPKKPASKESTRPEAFHHQIEKRLQERNAKKAEEEEEEEETHTFHSRPVPARILEEVVGVPERKVCHPTVPESPAFALKNRVRIEKKVEEVRALAPIKAHAAPHFGLPFQPHLPEKSQVEVCAFSFEERERERRALKEKRLEELRKEEVPKFKAQLLPDFTEVVLPEKKVLEPTKTEPFRLLIDERGAARHDRWDKMVKEEQKRLAEATAFKARPNTVTHKEPFLPKKENRSILEDINRSVVPEAFELSTERRAKERQEYERQLSEKETLRACVEEEHRKEQEEREKQELCRLRLEQVHKAQPIRHYKPVELKRSDVSLTIPQSPNFSDRFRM